MKTYLKLLIIMFLMIASPITTNAISSHPDVTIKTNDESININEEFYLYLTSSKVENLFSLSFDLKFNPNIINILSVEPGNFFKNEPIEFNSNFNLMNENAKILNFYATFTGNHNGKTSDSEVEFIKLKAKLLKECKVPFSIINTNNNLFIGTPNIRLIMVDNALNKCNFSNSTSYIQTNNFSNDDEIRLFISDVYKKTFSRDPEEYGFNYWYNKLISHEYLVRNFLINILNEKEFIDKDLSDEEFITSMYSIIANREPDQTGYNYWLNMLIEYQKEIDAKTSKSKIILSICNEAELEERATKLNLKF